MRAYAKASESCAVHTQGSSVDLLLQDDLASLQQRDPEFFAYLQQTDSDLLNFSLPPASKDTDEDAAADLNGEAVKVRTVCFRSSSINTVQLRTLSADAVA